MTTADTMKKSVIVMGYRYTIESPRLHFPGAELWGQSNSIRNWEWALYDWSRWFDVHTDRPQGQYGGIARLRPDIKLWYEKQGPERPIYFAEAIQSVRAGRVYPLAEIESALGSGRFGCQLDYMIALAIHEGFERIILSGNGAPYVDDPTSPAARKWHQRHASALWWLSKADSRGIEIVYDGPCMYRPFTGNYGFDMT